MFYDFAPHGDGANNNNNPIADVLGRLVLRLLSVFKCVHSVIVSHQRSPH